ncbi:hypothetical protein FT663_00097 [Candidozyma haemuli var. vulneris]|uniref:Uncharacterized protein n=1 Tax=Candidozyma haemuli TaxID=45357 RepID=A0A2V1AVK3_9ASCO|nr:hypothetical protein CXQ85_000883 [[Candida] haemuloni]KAF3994077.1 hypothetical protein FT662_00263 [[Candida] haemuloni var. vulneris]KAF3995874.1 hypothetical protein FT663_00097 [[Candida] haemuloni var. vulneris]PVH21888.1 hypothetical protein CXQ85_000883 [[Candida] haemuloni]
MDSLPDYQLVLAAAVSFFGIYGGLSLVLVKSQVPLLAAVFVASNMISRTSVFQRAVRSAVQRSQRRKVSLFSGGDKNAPEEHKRFEALASTSQVELLSAIKALDAYSKNSKGYNARRSKLFKLLSWRQQKMCEEIGYLQKLKSIDGHIEKNQHVMDDVIGCVKQEYGLTFRDFALLDAEKNLPNTSSTNYRVVEALTHFVRDWTPDGAVEREPLMDFVKAELKKVIPENEAAETCVVIPGSGLGRVAHEVASFMDFGAVYAVEFSGLMHACNKYVYQANKNHSSIFPYVHSCSNFVKTSSQFREKSLPTPQQPSNLHICLDDFRYFTVPNREKYKNIVVVSVFFVDTAENLIDYLDVIGQLTTPSKRNPVKNGYWINVGPLKYGTAAQVELTAEELQQLRKKIGWKDTKVVNTLNNEKEPVTGYITDRESMWQGFYGLSMWSSAQHANSRKTW